MYYKIENKECEVYKRLHALRMYERQAFKDNRAAVLKKVKLKFHKFIGSTNQQNFNRLPVYIGFNFESPEKVDLKIWKLDKEHEGYYRPNKRTKLGREMAEFLSNGLKKSSCFEIFDILSIQELSRFTFPWLEIISGTILLYLDEKQQVNDDNLIEITSVEFNKIGLFNDDDGGDDE